MRVSLQEIDKQERRCEVSDESNKKKAIHGRKINRMNAIQAKAAMANSEKNGDTSSKYYMACKAVAMGR